MQPLNNKSSEFSQGEALERKRHEIALARHKWQQFCLNIAEAESAMYLKVARELVEAGYIPTAQTMCFDALEEAAKRWKNNLAVI